MELKQLEYFRTIVDAGTISGAARDLHMTQPPLSYQIKMLEEELQVPLFLRGKKKNHFKPKPGKHFTNRPEIS